MSAQFTIEPSQQDLDHLQILGLFHYVVAGLTFLFGLFPIFHLAIGLGMFFAPGEFFGEAPPSEFPFRLFGLFFTLIPATMMAGAFAMSGALVVAGRRLRAHTHHMFCQVVGAVSCVFFPFGTVLGVFSLLVLQRPGVKMVFGLEPLGPTRS
jgi:hypothetical protein